MTAQIEQVERLITEPLEKLGCEIVRIQLRGQERQTLEIMIERTDRTPVSMDDCVRVSRQVSEILDVEDPFEKAYVLEVTSPGLDRPLVKPADFERFSGSVVKVKTHDAVEGRKRFRGILEGLKNEDVLIKLDSEEEESKITHVPLKSVLSAKLVPEDGMMENKPGKQK